jgi:hypothetical protein
VAGGPVSFVDIIALALLTGGRAASTAESVSMLPFRGMLFAHRREETQANGRIPS